MSLAARSSQQVEPSKENSLKEWVFLIGGGGLSILGVLTIGALISEGVDQARGIPTKPIGKAHRWFMKERMKELGGGQKAMEQAAMEWREARQAVVNTIPPDEDKRIAELIIQRLEKKTGREIPPLITAPVGAVAMTPEGKKIDLPKGTEIKLKDGATGMSKEILTTAAKAELAMSNLILDLDVNDPKQVELQTELSRVKSQIDKVFGTKKIVETITKLEKPIILAAHLP